MSDLFIIETFAAIVGLVLLGYFRSVLERLNLNPMRLFNVCAYTLNSSLIPGLQRKVSVLSDLGFQCYAAKRCCNF